MTELLSGLRSSVKNKFSTEKRILTYAEFLANVDSSPQKYLRTSADWVSDAFDYFEKRDSEGLFHRHYAGRFQPVFGQEEVKKKIRQIIQGFSQTGRIDKVIVLHGPNGSAKTTLCRNLFAALEEYSHTPEGALYSFSWVFPLDRGSRGMGIAKNHKEVDNNSYAVWPSEDIGAVLRSELHENPLFLIPKEERDELLKKWAKESDFLRSRFANANLGHKNLLLFETLLNEYQGDLAQVLKHVRVERFYFSHQLRQGLAVVEPQFGIDAGVRQITLDQTLSNLPPALQSLNLYQLEGELVMGNRGVIEFNDLLKRPLESFKYLLSVSETSRFQVGPYSAELDALLLATTNDHQLDSFREHSEFISFRGRFELVRVPYLLKYSDEEKIYERELKKFRETKEVMPHTARVLALWACMARLKKPITKNKSSILLRILETLSPLEKAKAYNDGSVPERFTEEERREFSNHLPLLIEEHKSDPFYEGLIGPSARELRMLLQNAVSQPSHAVVGPLGVLRELQGLVARLSDFEYLRIEPITGYHDYKLQIELAHQEWMRWVDSEIRATLGMGELPRIREILNDYIQKVRTLLSGEKIKNRLTGKSEMPDEKSLEAIENLLGHSQGGEEFRQTILGRLGAWSIENKPSRVDPLPLEIIFPDLVLKVRHSLRSEEDKRLQLMADSLAAQDIPSLAKRKKFTDQSLSPSDSMALQAFQGLQESFGYSPAGALEALGEYVRVRFRNEVKKDLT